MKPMVESIENHLKSKSKFLNGKGMGKFALSVDAIQLNTVRPDVTVHSSRYLIYTQTLNASYHILYHIVVLVYDKIQYSMRIISYHILSMSKYTSLTVIVIADDLLLLGAPSKPAGPSQYYVVSAIKKHVAGWRKKRPNVAWPGIQQFSNQLGQILVQDHRSPFVCPSVRVFFK